MSMLEVIRDRLRLATTQGMFLSDEERTVLEQELSELLESTSKCEAIDLAEGKLVELGEMHDILATISFKYKVDLSEKQRRFVREYDRWDLPEVRTAVFQAIKTGHFP